MHGIAYSVVHILQISNLKFARIYYGRGGGGGGGGTIFTNNNLNFLKCQTFL